MFRLFFWEWSTTVEGNMTEVMTGMDMTTAETMTAAEALTSVVKR
jgi:hypothetical protein